VVLFLVRINDTSLKKIKCLLVNEQKIYDRTKSEFMGNFASQLSLGKMMALLNYTFIFSNCGDSNMSHKDNEILLNIIKHNSQLMNILSFIRVYNHLNIYVGAGLIRNIVWGYLHNIEVCIMSSDIDLVYFDKDDQYFKQYQNFEKILVSQFSEFQWDLTNQANVHQWYVQYFHVDIAPFGLTDLLNMIIRWNPTLISYEYYKSRVREKRYAEQWPRVTIL